MTEIIIAIVFWVIGAAFTAYILTGLDEGFRQVHEGDNEAKASLEMHAAFSIIMWPVLLFLVLPTTLIALSFARIMAKLFYR